MLTESVYSNYILLAEDNPADANLVRVALEDRAVACDLHVVPDGDQAIKFIERIDRDSALNCPQLLLLDLRLPKRDGEEVLRSLRASERCGHTTVVIMTSSDLSGDMEKASRQAALQYFRKPTTLAQFMTLGDVVKEIIERTANPKGKGE